MAGPRAIALLQVSHWPACSHGDLEPRWRAGLPVAQLSRQQPYSFVHHYQKRGFLPPNTGTAPIFVLLQLAGWQSLSPTPKGKIICNFLSLATTLPSAEAVHWLYSPYFLQ